VAAVEKAPGAFKTIGELSIEIGVAQHILRYWETKFPQLRPLQRAGNRRYYRPADVDLVRQINRLLNQEGYTVRGVQKLLRERGGLEYKTADTLPNYELKPNEQADPKESEPLDLVRLKRVRDRLSAALEG
jgi:DNA-binding transcriptional MerR regulator